MSIALSQNSASSSNQGDTQGKITAPIAAAELSGEFPSKMCSLVNRSLDELNDQRDALMLVAACAVAMNRPDVALSSSTNLNVASALSLPSELAIAATLTPLIDATNGRFAELIQQRFGISTGDYLQNNCKSGLMVDMVNSLPHNESLLEQIALQSCSHYSVSDIKTIIKANQYVHDLYGDITRGWSPDRKIYLSSHAVEVGVILLHSKAAPEVIISGLLHDALESYAKEEEATITNQILNNFGAKVCSLVLDVTESPKGSCSWWDRKISVLKPLLDSGEEVASVIAASKISTLGSGVRHYQKGFDNWSAGSLQENCSLFEAYQKCFVEKQISPILRKCFDEELNRLRDVMTERTLQ
jgi:hypothetical protein